MLTLINHQNIFPVLVVMKLICLLEVMVSAENCTLGKKFYKLGETWTIDDVATFGKNCINCTCLPGGDAHCQKPDCPKPKCDEPKILEGQCCPSCEDIDNLPPTVGTDNTESHRKAIGCNYEGEHYDHDAVFPSNKTSLARKENHCALCKCFNGTVNCYVRACSETPGCKKMVELDDDCCLRCAMLDSLKPISKSDCQTPFGIMRNGTKFSPNLTYLASSDVKCVECSCLNTKFRCRRLKCPKQSKLTCDDPVPDEDGCCRECPDDKIKRRKKKENINCKNAKTPATKEKCLNSKTTSKHNRKKSNKEDVTVFHEKIHLYDVVNKLCIPRSAERIIYYSKGESFISLSFDDIKNNTIYQTYWELKNNRIEKIDTRTITMPDEFRKSTLLTDIMGAIDSKTEKAFWKKLNKRQGRCKKKCRRKLVETSIRKLKLFKIDLSKKKCHL